MYRAESGNDWTSLLVYPENSWASAAFVWLLMAVPNSTVSGVTTPRAIAGMGSASGISTLVCQIGELYLGMALKNRNDRVKTKQATALRRLTTCRH